MIVQIRGTHGSGKTTAVKRIMESYEVKKTHYLSGRGRPIGYALSDVKRDKELFVPGSYESPTGGCDTIPKIEQIYEIIKRQHDQGFNILYEGILAQHSTPRILALRPRPLHVIVLDTPIEMCIAAVQQRRDERGETKPLNPENIIREAKSVLSAARRLKDAGVQVTTCTRQHAIELATELLYRD